MVFSFSTVLRFLITSCLFSGILCQKAHKFDKVLELNDGVIISGNISDGWYSDLSITIDSKKVYFDTSYTEYYLDNPKPHVRKLKNGNLEIILLISGRPGKDFLLYLMIENDRIVRKDTLAAPEGSIPKFSEYPDNHFADYMDYTEAICENCDSTSYNPILSYAVTDSGIFLDSAATVKENEKRYGRFYGYTFIVDLHLLIVK